MLSRLALNAARPARKQLLAVAPARMAFQARFLSQKAIPTGTTGRKMPVDPRRETAEASKMPATFTIQGGPIFQGTAFGANANVSGEAVFTTSLVAYPESMTDPSYRGQILVFTTPLIGNYGVPSNERDQYGLLKYFESPHIQCAGVVVSDIATQYSHWTAVESLSKWCAREGVPIISGVDTRAIVTLLREEGSSLARISMGESYDQDEDAGYTDPGQQHLVSHVSTKAPFLVESEGASLHIALIDCGVKENILRSLVARGASLTVFPYDFPIHKVAQHFDGVFISNGPGDPLHLTTTVQNVRQLMDTSDIPIMGVCMGHQVIGLAAGARTVKLPYGNRGTTSRLWILQQALRSSPVKIMVMP
uniref:Carbamoyl phosphate synthase arginine-specific small chain n=1 Tax=Bionectria ochroleuca TaxID=29856 RepID=A0A8H7KFV0_BIOOC